MEHKFGEWYPIEELKEFGKMVLLYSTDIFIGEKIKDLGLTWYIDDSGRECATKYQPRFWMPLPPPPKEREK